MAVKRRVIWMTDEDWGAIGGLAEANGLTVSAFVRDRLVADTTLEREVLADPPWVKPPPSTAVAPVFTDPAEIAREFRKDALPGAVLPTTRKSAQAERDAILRRITKEKR